MERRNRRTATGRKGFHQRVGNGNRNLRDKFHGCNQDDNRRIHDRRVHLAMREDRHSAFVVGMPGVGVEEFMQLR